MYIFNATLHTATSSSTDGIPNYHDTKAWKEGEMLHPISLLPVMSKVFEKTIFKRLKPVLEDLNIIPDYHFGFCSGHGTNEKVQE